ncbi:hypothetical protein CSC14_0191 [Proteus mirabilis]|nr:hypothetical protein CSC14_0191 [Proteus mirabilis]
MYDKFITEFYCIVLSSNKIENKCFYFNNRAIFLNTVC